MGSFTGVGSSYHTRSFYAFDLGNLDNVTVTGASVFFRPNGTYRVNGTTGLRLYNVITPASAVLGGSGGAAAFNDFGSGVVLGGANVGAGYGSSMPGITMSLTPNAVTLIANRDAEFQSADVLLTATLRMRPDRIILGEVRGKEAMTFLEAINTGHGGSMTTLHAETPQLAVQRLAIAALKTEIPMTYQDMVQYIESSIDVIIQAGREDGQRGITEFYLPGTDLSGGMTHEAV